MKRLLAVALVCAVGYLGMVSSSREEAALSPEERAARESARAESQKPREQTKEFQIGLARFALKQRARDPESMQFRNEVMYTRGDTLVVCGEVNSKNGFGGYTGFKSYVGVRGAAVTESDAKELGAGVVSAFFAMCKSR